MIGRIRGELNVHSEAAHLKVSQAFVSANADEYLAQADAIRAEAAIGYLDGAGGQNFALMAAAATAGDRIVFAAAGDLGFIHLGEIGLRI